MAEDQSECQQHQQFSRHRYLEIIPVNYIPLLENNKKQPSITPPITHIDCLSPKAKGKDNYSLVHSKGTFPFMILIITTWINSPATAFLLGRVVLVQGHHYLLTLYLGTTRYQNRHDLVHTLNHPLAGLCRHPERPHAFPLQQL